MFHLQKNVLNETTFLSGRRLIECSKQVPDQQFPRFRFPLSAMQLPTYYVRPPLYRGPSLLNDTAQIGASPLL
jgi:hypothetical protein